MTAQADRAARVALLMTGSVDVGDPSNPLTWSVDGRHPTPEELALLSAMTPEDFEDAITLLRVDQELQRRMTLESLRGFCDAVARFLDTYPGWGVGP